MNLARLSFAATLACTASAAQANETLSCLQEHFHVEVISTTKETLESRSVRIAVQNDSGFAVGGVWVDFSIHAEGRPLPLYEGSVREAATIPGGLLPGETLQSEDFHFMDERASSIAEQADNIQIAVQVRNVADAQMLGFFDHPVMGSWADGITAERCE